MNLHELIDRLHKEHTLTRGEFITLIKERDEENASYLASLAREEAVKIYGNGVFPRGLVEFTNYCKNNCYYCGIQGSNQHANRYRLSKMKSFLPVKMVISLVIEALSFRAGRSSL